MYAVGHMAINTDDVEETLAFYRPVCGWQFEAWVHRASTERSYPVPSSSPSNSDVS
jgi:predicted enzyme related to lactoylglutathione lyase